MIAVCIVVAIALLLSFMFLLVAKYGTKDHVFQGVHLPTHDDGLVEVTPLKHCFHKEKSMSKDYTDTVCCFCGQSRWSMRSVKGHGNHYTVETDITNEVCDRRTYYVQ